jgi:RNA polymerase sigma-70 factor (ECF subfamily)
MAALKERELAERRNLDELFGAHYARVARVIGRVIQDPARAEEIAVEVFVKWSRNVQAQGAGAEGWLYRTATREALDEWRRQGRRERFERLFSVFVSRPLDPERALLVSDEQQRVRGVLAAIDKRAASLLLLWSEELSYRDMAAALEVNPNYVGSLLSRAQEAFRKEYRRRYGNE